MFGLTRPTIRLVTAETLEQDRVIFEDPHLRVGSTVQERSKVVRDDRPFSEMRCALFGDYADEP